MYINLVDTFLQTGSYPDKRKRPKLFCNDDFLQRFPWDAAAVDKNGEYMVNSLTGQHWTIRQIYSSHEGKDKFVPYFVPDMNAYFFDTPHLVGCRQGSLGETFTSIPDAHSSLSPVKWTSTMDAEMVIICPEAVDGSHSYLDSLGETGWIDPASHTPLDRLVPESATLYHELYHLVSGRIGYRLGMKPEQYLERMVGDYASCELSIATQTHGHFANHVQHCEDVLVSVEIKQCKMQKAICISLWLTGTSTMIGATTRRSPSTRDMRFTGIGCSTRCKFKGLQATKGLM